MYKKNCLTSILEKVLGKRVYPIYRLDRETSGIVVFSKEKEITKSISEKISGKEYVAICSGNIKKKLVINEPIGERKGDFIKWKKCVSPEGKKACTEIVPQISLKDYSFVKAIPKTGRQHQIRVHLQHIGHPIIGDKIYGESDLEFATYLLGKKSESRQTLHLRRILIDGKEITSDIPKDIKKLWNDIIKNASAGVRTRIKGLEGLYPSH